MDESNATQILGYVLLHFINHSQHFIIFNFSNVHVFLFQVGNCARILDLVTFLHLKQQHGIGISLNFDQFFNAIIYYESYIFNHSLIYILFLKYFFHQEKRLKVKKVEFELAIAQQILSR